MVAKRGFFRYIKKAFLHHWNVLALAAGAAVAFISGQPDVVLPLVGAAEVVYLAGLSTHRRFQAAVDAEEHKAAKMRETRQSSEKARLILKSLKDEDREHFERLRRLCAELRQISRGVKAQAEEEGEFIDDLQAGGINRLLWIYLKLLYSKNALELYFDKIDEADIKRRIDKLTRKHEALGPADQDNQAQAKKRKSLQDTLQTATARLVNYQRAKENYEFIELELERLHTKIASLAEAGISRRDPDYISNEVDSVSASVEQTEKAMGELEFLTGLSSQDEAPPGLMDAESEVEAPSVDELVE